MEKLTMKVVYYDEILEVNSVPVRKEYQNSWYFDYADGSGYVQCECCVPYLEPEEKARKCEWHDETNPVNPHGWETGCGGHFGFGLYPPIHELTYCPKCGRIISHISSKDAKVEKEEVWTGVDMRCAYFAGVANEIKGNRGHTVLFDELLSERRRQKG